MDRAFLSGASGTPPAAPGSPSIGYAQSGNPGLGVPATKPGPYWYHMVTEEIRQLIVDAGLTPSQSNLTQLSEAVVARAGQRAGEVCLFARNTAPTGFLKANGALISRTVYSALFTAIGTTFGVGDGSTTFALPDLRGEFLRSWDDARGIDAARAFGTSQSDAIRNITGSMAQVSFVSSSTATGALSLTPNGTHNGAASGISGLSTVAFSAASVVPTAAENRPRNIALLACIKF